MGRELTSKIMLFAKTRPRYETLSLSSVAIKKGNQTAKTTISYLPLFNKNQTTIKIQTQKEHTNEGEYHHQKKTREAKAILKPK